MKYERLVIHEMMQMLFQLQHYVNHEVIEVARRRLIAAMERACNLDEFVASFNEFVVTIESKLFVRSPNEVRCVLFLFHSFRFRENECFQLWIFES